MGRCRPGKLCKEEVGLFNASFGGRDSSGSLVFIGLPRAVVPVFERVAAAFYYIQPALLLLRGRNQVGLGQDAWSIENLHLLTIPKNARHTYRPQSEHISLSCKSHRFLVLHVVWLLCEHWKTKLNRLPTAHGQSDQNEAVSFDVRKYKILYQLDNVFVGVLYDTLTQ